MADPVRWYQQIHPDDKQRWSLEAANRFLSGQPLKSALSVAGGALQVRDELKCSFDILARKKEDNK